MVRNQHRYELLTWPEINEAVRQEKVVILPVAATEQHGYHLPLDVDSKLAGSVALAAGERSPADMLVLPTVAYGYCHHVMDFPGTINITQSTFVNLLLDITRSVAYHGFKKIVIVNGHGSNHPLVEQVGRQTILQTDALCCTLSWWQLVAEKWNAEIRESEIGGCAHACELETSMYLHLDPNGVRTDRIDGELPDFMRESPESEAWRWVDLTLGSGPAGIVNWTSAWSRTGAIGRPDLGSAEKGRLAFEHAVDRLVGLVRWLRAHPTEPRRDRHATPPTFDLPFGF
ncbi:MAG: creatininase family protein [Thermomicrobiales bacterium]|nr:creatininase family protein [Thermomicrobiales bacterium]